MNRYPQNIGEPNSSCGQRKILSNKQNRSTIKGKARAKKNNDVNNPVNNPVYYAIKKDKVRAKAEAYLKDLGVDEELLRPEGADAIVEDLLKVDEYKTIFESLSNEKCSAYVCYSASDIETERTCFASNRGDRNPITS